MLLVLFILFGLQHQIQCNSAFRYPQDNRTSLNWQKNELRLKNDDYEDGRGAKSNAKSNAKGQGLGLPGKMAPAKSASDAFRMNVAFNDESREAQPPPAHRRSFNDPPKDHHAPLSPVFSNRLKHSKHKPRERVYQEEPESPSELNALPALPALIPPQAKTNLSRLIRTNDPLNLVDELQQRKDRLNAELAGPQMRVDVGLPPAVIAYGSSKEEDRDVVVDVPDANLLDMAKAIGGKVPGLRYRNRLCSRHVLIPEGPKYDSKGSTYLAAFSPKAPKGTATTRMYNVTHPPHFLLPKCCNCCKKSVLGCE